MGFDPELAEIRFGTGLGPGVALAADAGAFLARLGAADRVAGAFPVESFAAQRDSILRFRALGKRARNGDGAAREERDRLKRAHRQKQLGWFAHTGARWLESPDGFRERLTRFWADHFTVVGKSAITGPLGATFVEDAIRPHLTGRFGEMLRAAETHPMMLDYLDQLRSVGEGSPLVARGKGLNENLAREILELHTLGVDGPYGQGDVRQLANLLAGFALDRQGRVTFYPRRGNPGPEVVLGRSYGGARPRAEDALQALDDLATHPATARHIARKLVVHFVSDQPDAAHVDHVAARFAESGGALTAVYEALLEHPSAWVPGRVKIKQPFDFVMTSMKALGVKGAQLAGLEPGDIRQGLAMPMALMGQAWERPGGPDGWPEAGAHWITPQGLAARIQWAMTIPLLLFERIGGGLPDPRALLRTALGAQAGEAERIAAAAAETRWEGVGLVLASPGFQRR